MSKPVKPDNYGIYTVTLAGISAQTVTITGPNATDFIVTDLETDPEGFPGIIWLANFTVTKTEVGKEKKVKIHYKVKVNGMPAGMKMVVLENGNSTTLDNKVSDKDFDQDDPAVGMTK